jgi:hypothetical protein
MPHNHEWQTRIKAVEREYAAMRQGADRFLRAAHDDPNILRQGLRHVDIVGASKHLEATYIIRLFSEFETGARRCWATQRDTHPKTADLLDGLAARCDVLDTQLARAHQVREYRNGLVHERDDEPEIVPIGPARHHLCHFFSFLPPRW